MNDKELKAHYRGLLKIKLEMQAEEEELKKIKKEWRLFGELVRIKAQKVGKLKIRLIEGIE